MIRNLLLTIGLILFTGVMLHAQQAALQGKVIDKDTKEPIPFANIVVEPDTKLLFQKEGKFGKYDVRYELWKVHGLLAECISALALKMIMYVI